MKKYTDKQIIDKIKSLKSFKEIPSDYFVVGIRSHKDIPNSFDDKFYIFKGADFVVTTSGTTNPGTPVLEGGFLKYNKAGAALVKADEWYYNVWKPGLHHSKMPALVQVENFIVFRDGDKDKKSEEQGVPSEGLYGINFHTVSYDLNVKKVGSTIGSWSAGCQVCNDVAKYSLIINLLKQQKRISYVLLNEF